MVRGKNLNRPSVPAFRTAVTFVERALNIVSDSEAMAMAFRLEATSVIV